MDKKVMLKRGYCLFGQQYEISSLHAYSPDEINIS